MLPRFLRDGKGTGESKDSFPRDPRGIFKSLIKVEKLTFLFPVRNVCFSFR